jgi:hypothetical protein
MFSVMSTVPKSMKSAESQPSAPASTHTASTPPSPPASPTDPSDTLPAGAATSPLFKVRNTPTAGRAVFATQSIPEDTLIWRSDDLTLSVLLREYRREVCGQCFRYERGRDLDIRDKSVGFAFCTEGCRQKWKDWNGEVGVKAWAAVEALVKKRSKEDSDMVDVDLPRPKMKEIDQAWEAADAQAALIRTARQSEYAIPGQDGPAQVTKQQRKAVQKALQQTISPDVMSFCLSGMLWRHNNPKDWPKLLALADDATPYHNTADLGAFVKSYLQLLAILPLPLLPLITHETLIVLSSRDSHNSFGIRSLDDDGSEFFGYGCWPAASYFNHSCGPNVEKRREGRVWQFRAGKDIDVGEELCITYLSGEERKLSRGKRTETLRKNWGFDCACERCDIR